ncbi:MAG: hypothetical protein J6X32_06245 [Salinivirgaceae bacterium]|nr:hypothetical protein [Salinivirgaceae bacterium]
MISQIIAPSDNGGNRKSNSVANNVFLSEKMLPEALFLPPAPLYYITEPINQQFGAYLPMIGGDGSGEWARICANRE